MSVPPGILPRVFVDGIDIGRPSISPPHQFGREIRIDIEFKPNWVGIWKLMALAADQRRQ